MFLRCWVYMNRHMYTNEEDKFLIENVKGISLKELTLKFNRKFNLNLSENKIANRKAKLHLSSGITGGQFQKGQISFNKGKKWNDYLTKEQQERAKKTCFKKGNIPNNHRIVGSERITIDGYVEIKVAEPNKWELKSRVIYERVYGKIPDNHKIIYLDGNKKNLDISNLKAISYAEELIMNKNKLRFDKKELTETGYLISKIINERGKLKRERL